MNHTITLPMDILVADDHVLVCEGLKNVLEEMPEIGMVDTADSIEELSGKLRSHSYDLFFLDVEMCGRNGLDMVPSIRRVNRRAAIVLCTMHEEVWTLHSMLKVSPDGIVLKLSGLECIRQAVRAVSRGEKYYCPRFRQLYGKLLENGQVDGARKRKPTPREQDVLQAIAEGLSTLQIAERMYVSENTVETYRKNLMQKLEARNVADLVVKGIERGFIHIGLNHPE